MKKHRFLSVFLSLVLVLSIVCMGTVFAALGDSNGETTPPATGKTLVSNGDGTYTLSLSVTGKAETTSESNKADVIVVLDRSGSMDESVEGYVANQTGRYGLVNRRYVNLYYLHNGDYRSLENDTYTGTVYYQTWSLWSEYTYTEYTGTRYEYMDSDRLAVAKSAISTLADQLGSYNKGNPDAVRFALVTFASTARTETFSQNSTWTTNVTTFKNKVNSDTIRATGGTNWEDALQKANGLSVREDAEVYVIFVSDGNPTFYVGGGSGQETSSNVSMSYNKAKDDAKAIVNAGKNFYGIGVFGSVDRMKNLVTDAGAPSGNYYSATDSAGLQVAFSDIIGKITKALGYKDVKIEDGITSMTSALVKTDPTSFTYMRSGGSYGDGATWTPDDAQKAKYEGGKVSWDLGNAQLENGVTYTVSFKVWPSQEVYDIVADLNNEIKDYEDLTADQKAQIVELEGGGYGLKTNTDAKVTYTQVETRATATAPEGFVEGQPADDGYTYTYDSETGIYTGTKETQGSADISNPDPMVLTSSMITIEKTWDDDYLGDNVRPDSPITLNIKKDGANYKSLELEKANDWKANVYVAPGVIVNGETLETGHSYAIEEANTDVHYELDADDFKPMLVDNVLIADYETGATAANATIKVTNVRKGDLIISKTVETYDGGTVDLSKEFEMKVTFKKGTETWAPAEADQVTYKIGATGTAQPFPSDGVIKLKHGGTATISNLPAGITYTVVEQNLSAGYTQIAPTSAATGTIVGDSAQRVDFTNQYSTSSVSATIPVTKILSVPSGLTGPGSIKEAYTFTLSAVTEGAPMPEAGGETVKNPDDNGGTANFGAITFDAPGTYKYKITESGTVAGVTNDSAATTGKEVTVTVEDNGDGTLSATVIGATPTDNDVTRTTFTNTYENSTPATIQLSASKKLNVEEPANNAPDVTEKYDLTLAAVNDAPMPESAVDGKVTVKNPDSNATAVSFGTIEYTMPGVYQYTVSESGNVPGVTNGQTAYSVSVQVTDNQDGTMTAKVTSGSQTTKFTNTYSVSSAVLAEGKISVNKNLTGTNLSAGAFNFEIKASEETPNAPLPAVATVTNNARGVAAFGEITYTRPGSYKYAISEIDGGLSGYTYDDNVVYVLVKVVDNGNGTMSASVEYENDPSFNNTYTASGSVQITAQKKLTGRALEDGQFSFKLTALDGGPGNNLTATNNASGQIVFERIDFSNTDLTKKEEIVKTYVQRYINVDDENDVLVTLPDGAVPGSEEGTWTITESGTMLQKTYKLVYVNKENPEDTLTMIPDGAEINDDDGSFTLKFKSTEYASKTFTYNISEVAGSASGYTYDTHTETVVITVKDNGDGTLSVIATYDPSGAVFNNTYSAKGSVVLKGTKSVTGTGLRSEQFIFNLIDKDNNILSTAKNDATGAFAFGALNYTEKDAGKTFTYTIVEVNDGQGGYAYDSKVCEVTVTVKDNGDGTLSAAASYTPDANFNNTYSAFGSVTFTGTKTVTGGTLESGQFTFNLLDQAGNVIGQATNAADGSFAFAPVSYTIADAGKTFNYSIVEVNDGQGGYTYDTKVCKISVNVTDLGDGVLKTDVAYEGDASFVNSYATSSTEVVLTAKKTLSGRKLADGEFSFTVSQGDNVIATGKNDVNGNITFSAIPLTKAGTYRFTVAEVIGSKEGVTYDKKTYTYVVVVEDVNGKLTVKDVSIDGATEVVFSNTYKTTPPPEPPKTGDNTNLGLWLALMCLGAAGFTGSVLFGRRKRQRK